MIIEEDERKSFSTFTFADQDARHDVKTIIEKFHSFYQPTTNLTYNEFVFDTRNQKEGEPFNEWLMGIRVLANKCELGDLEERLLRSKRILGFRNKKLQQKIIADNSLYTKAVERFRAWEQGEEQFNTIQSEAKAHGKCQRSARTQIIVRIVCVYKAQK